MPHAFLCDFDGTASPSDIGAAFARRFSPGGAAETPAFLERWMRGEIGHRELTVAQCALLSVTREEALAFARPFALDPHFAPFVRESEARGDAVCVVSEGFDFYVRDLLERAGLGHVPWSANVARFVDRRVTPEFPHTPDACGRCGNCKGSHVRAWRARGYRTVVIGDGLSDRCGAAEADRVLARRDLLAWCRDERIAVTAFDTFADVRHWYQAPVGGRPGDGREPGGGAEGEREPGKAERALDRARPLTTRGRAYPGGPPAVPRPPARRAPTDARPGIPARRGGPASRAARAERSRSAPASGGARGAARPPHSSRDPWPLPPRAGDDDPRPRTRRS